MLLKGFAFLLALTTLLYLAGVTPASLKQSIEQARASHATVPAMDDGADV